jgi:RNA polymerase sigma factor (sigma-70 family)
MASESLADPSAPTVPADTSVQVAYLYDAHALGLIRLAYLMLGSQPAAEDFVQDAFCGLYRRWRHIADHGKALLYVRSAVINGCRSELRRRKFLTANDIVMPTGASAEDSALVKEDRRQAILALASLPDRQRQVLVLRFYRDGWESDSSLPLLRGSGVRLLKVTSPGGGPVARSRLVVPFTNTKRGVRTSAGYPTGTLLSPDGKTIAEAVVTSGGHRAAFAIFSAATGALERVIDQGPYKVGRPGGPIWVMWVSSDGGTLIVYAPPSHPDRLGVLRGTRLTFLPRPPALSFPYAAW